MPSLDGLVVLFARTVEASLLRAQEPSPVPATSAGSAPSALLPSAAELESYLAQARASWPELSGVSDEALVVHVAERCDGRGLPPPQHAGDLLLALGCLHGQPLALAAFEQAHGELIARVLRHRGATSAVADDVAQSVRERLLLGLAGASPQIAGYRGTGPLRSWVAIAVSTQLAMARRGEQRRREQPPTALLAADDAAADLIAGDPELGYLRDRYRVEAEQAIAQALRTLGDRERVLLRLQLGDRLTLEQLAALYGVNRATVVRWLAKARALLLDGIRRELGERTGAAAETCDSLLRLVHSQLDVSVLRHLT